MRVLSTINGYSTLLRIGGVEYWSMSTSIFMSGESEVKVLTRDGEQENKRPEAELGESEER